MSKFKAVNANPQDKNVGDCTVRAISIATGRPWESVYLDLCIQGYTLSDMPSSNAVWGKYLADRGWQYRRLPDTCPFCYTVEDFCKDHPGGIFIVGTGSHVVCVIDGEYYDAWDSGEKTPLFFFMKE